MVNAARAKIDADRLLAMLPSDIPPPDVGDAEDAEVFLYWNLGNRKATVVLEGDGMFGFALYKGGRYVPGGEDGDLSRPGTLDELVAYLRDKVDQSLEGKR